MGNSVLYFSSGDCVPCRTIKPMVMSLCKAKGLQMREFNIDEYGKNPHVSELMDVYFIRTVPSAVVLDDGGGQEKVFSPVTVGALKKYLDDGE